MKIFLQMRLIQSKSLSKELTWYIIQYFLCFDLFYRRIYLNSSVFHSMHIMKQLNLRVLFYHFSMKCHIYIHFYIRRTFIQRGYDVDGYIEYRHDYVQIGLFTLPFNMESILHTVFHFSLV
jgi:hypothetical protein